MDYQKVYNQLIERAKLRNSIKGEGVYLESHHIIPRCLGGSDKKENLVNLTAREHFLAHWLLSRIYPDNYKISHAFWMISSMSVSEKRYTPSSRAYSEAKEKHSQGVSKKRKLEPIVYTEELRKKMSESAKLRVRSPHSEETKRKISLRHTGVKHSEERRKKNSEVHKGYICSEETRKKLSELAKKQIRVTPSEETRQKIREANTGKKRTEEEKERLRLLNTGRQFSKIQCPHCKEDVVYWAFERHSLSTCPKLSIYKRTS